MGVHSTLTQHVEEAGCKKGDSTEIENRDTLDTLRDSGSYCSQSVTDTRSEAQTQTDGSDDTGTSLGTLQKTHVVVVGHRTS